MMPMHVGFSLEGDEGVIVFAARLIAPPRIGEHVSLDSFHESDVADLRECVFAVTHVRHDIRRTQHDGYRHEVIVVLRKEK